MNSYISPDNHWIIWTSLLTIATLSIYLEQKYKIFQKLTGALVAMIGGMILSNVGFLPTESVSYDIIWEYIVPLTIPMLLMKTDIRRIIKETGRLFWAFHLSALGTIIGSIVAIALLYAYVPQLELIVPAMTGSYIGGGINFVALVATFEPPRDLVNATIVADNAIMALYFILLIAIPSMVMMRKIFPKSKLSESFYNSDSGASEGLWKAKQISLLDIGLAITIAFIITSMSAIISEYFSGEGFPALIKIILGQKYILLTTLSILFPILFPKLSKKINGSDELGTFLIFIFFALIGVPASIKTVLLEAPVMLIFCAIILAFNFLTTFSLGKFFKFELEELVLAAIVTSGGPMNGVAIANAKKWHALMVPSLLIGIWGYIIGNYTGYFVGLILAQLF